MNNKIFLVILLSIILVGTISAFEFDNIKSYDARSKTLTVENAFGFGAKISEVELKSNLNVEVPVGYQKVAEFEVRSQKDYNNILSQLDFYDVKNDMREIDRDFDIKYLDYKQIEVQDFEEKCSLLSNKTLSCNNVLVGTHLEDRENWKDFEGNVVSGNPLTLGIFTNVQAGDKVEWIPNLFGVRVEEWATWTQSLNVDLKVYHNFNQTNILEDVVTGTYNLTNGSAYSLGTGTLLPRHLELGESGGSNVSVGYTGNYSWGSGIDGTMNIWFQAPNDAGTSGGEQYLLQTTNERWRLHYQTSGGLFRLEINDVLIWQQSLAGNWSAGDWVMMTITWDADSDNTYLYLDGAEVLHSTTTYSELNDTDFFLGKNTGSAGYFNGNISELGVWYRVLNSTEISDLYNGGTGISYTDTFPTPSVSLLTPLNNTITLNTTINFTANQTAPFPYNNTNSTFYLWYNNDTLRYSNATSLSGNGSEIVSWNVPNLNTSIYKWNVYGCFENSTTNLCLWSENNNTFTINDFTLNNMSYSSSTFETKTETFTANITVPTGTTPSLGEFIYNGTTYTGVTISNSSSNYLLSKTLDIPVGTGNKSFSFNFTLDGQEYSTDDYYQNVNLTLFTISNSTYNVSFLNISFKDENSLSPINASIPSSQFTYYLGTGSVNKTYNFINTTDHYSYSFAGTTGSENLKVIPVVQYRRVNDYPQRIWQPSVQTYNSTMTNQILYLLNTDDGIFVTYQVVANTESPIEGVSVTSTRLVGAETIQVGSGTTDISGTVTFWMNPDFEHITTFNKTGYDDFTFVHYPTQTSYTITLGGGTTTDDNCIEGVLQTINPSQDFLFKNQDYNFNYTVSSSYWNLSSFQFTLTYSNGTVISTPSSSSSSGGTISSNGVNVTNSSTITMNYLYEISGSDTCTQVSGVRVWITQSSDGTDFSIWRLFQDSNSYISAGLFGFDNFGKTLVSFLIIVLVVGGLSRRYGLASEAAIMGILFGVVFLLDVGLGFIPNVQIGSIQSVDNFFTYITFIILLMMIIREERR